jgi:hypothetical protein
MVRSSNKDKPLMHLFSNPASFENFTITKERDRERESRKERIE